MNVFFYGLFMDREVLAGRDISAAEIGPGFLDGFALRIGERATLAHQAGSRAYGIVMAINPHAVAALYAEDSVADYKPEFVQVELTNGATLDASCYNLPANRIAGTNKEYAARLLALATRLGFPDAYLDEIRQAL